MVLSWVTERFRKKIGTQPQPWTSLLIEIAFQSKPFVLRMFHKIRVKKMKTNLLRVIMAAFFIGLTGCSVLPAAANPGMLQSKVKRITLEDVPVADTASLVDGNNAFATNIYQALRETPGNLFFSPYSINQALSMTYAGSNGKTSQQMADALKITLPDSRYHATLNALDVGMAANGENQAAESSFKLSVVNALWGQTGYAFQADFLDLLSRYYGSGVHTLDFNKAPEESRQAINGWVSQQTNQRIQDLIAKGVIDPNTRMVLTNAIYFKANWQKEFEKNMTSDGPFFISRDSAVQVPFMHRLAASGYINENGVQVVELPYSNQNFSMVILMPDADTFQQFEQSIDASKLAALITDISSKEVDLSLPKFKFEDGFGLAKTLQGLGMIDAFTPGVADFSKMDGGKGQLFIQDVVHKAFISVDEQGTEAAAATGVVVGTTAMPAESVKMVIDHPFMFLIRDRQSGAILFIGRVVNPK